MNHRALGDVLRAIAVLAVAGGIWSAHTWREWDKQAEKETGILRREAKLDAMRLRYNAAVVRIDYLGRQTTAQVQQLLDREDRRPVLIRGLLEDVVRSEGGYVAVLVDWEFGPITYRLRCTEAVARAVGNASRFDSYAVVARVTTVRVREKPDEELQKWVAEGDWLEAVKLEGQ
jgi:hypothetical protein